MICKSCGAVRSTILPGSGVLEAVLWIAIPFWPAAVVYSVWRRTSRRKACASCGSAELVALDTPVGRQLARAHYPGGLPPVPAAPAAAGPLRVLGAIGVGVVGLIAWLAIFKPGV